MFLQKLIPIDNKHPDINDSRKRIFSKHNQNLNYLLEKRFLWMETFLKNRKVIIELGSGNGCIKSVLKNNIILTDIIQHEWIDEEVDMLELNLNKRYLNNVDAIIINHSLHHCANPYQTLKKMNKYLKKGGLVLINEPESSITFRLIQVILKDEGFDETVDVFNNKNLFFPRNPWLSNTSIAKLLFKNKKKFEENFPEYFIKKNQVSEFIIFLNSGGVNSAFKYLKLNKFLLNLVNIFDSILIKIFPSIFALNRMVVLEKK
jgi:SAM-dependent methyltransferase